MTLQDDCVTQQMMTPLLHGEALKISLIVNLIMTVRLLMGRLLLLIAEGAVCLKGISPTLHWFGQFSSISSPLRSIAAPSPFTSVWVIVGESEVSAGDEPARER